MNAQGLEVAGRQFAEDRILTAAGGTDKLTGVRRTLTIADAGNADSTENGDAVEDHD